MVQVRDTYQVRFVATPHAQATSDMLVGAKAIAEFMFGDHRRTRKIYYLIESGRLPVFRLGGICARKSTLLAWLNDHERGGGASFLNAGEQP